MAGRFCLGNGHRWNPLTGTEAPAPSACSIKICSTFDQLNAPTFP